VAKRHRMPRSMASALVNNVWAHNITGALTVSVLTHYIDLLECLQHIQLALERSDAFT
jgi:hypothetical protein